MTEDATQIASLDSMDMNLSKTPETMEDRGALAKPCRKVKSRTRLSG